ncbi:amino acid ABC transporter permease, partial [Halobacteriales archaeon SW_7_71_33]
MRDGLIRRAGELLSVGVLLLVIGAVGFIAVTQVNTDLLTTVFPQFVEAFWLVVRIVAVSSLLSVTLGLLVGLARISRSPVTGRIAKGYVEFFRGTPLLFQLFLIFFG